MVATRMRDTAFKRELASAAPGTRIRVEGPQGDMVLHENAERPAVFLAGGIGVTPFLSMARDAAHRRLSHRMTLFYFNRRPERAAFLDELMTLEQLNPNFHLVATVGNAERSSWSGETGPIRPEMLKRYVPDFSDPVFYFAGPHGMTLGMELMLNDLGVNDDDMCFEEFYGY